jgi:hypothetical protein
MDLNRFFVQGIRGFLDRLVRQDWQGHALGQLVADFQQFISWVKGEVLAAFEHLKKIEILGQALLEFRALGCRASLVVELMSCFVAFRLFDMIELEVKDGLFDRIQELGRRLFLDVPDSEF